MIDYKMLDKIVAEMVVDILTCHKTGHDPDSCPRCKWISVAQRLIVFDSIENKLSLLQALLGGPTEIISMLHSTFCTGLEIGIRAAHQEMADDVLTRMEKDS